MPENNENNHIHYFKFILNTQLNNQGFYKLKLLKLEVKNIFNASFWYIKT